MVRSMNMNNDIHSELRDVYLFETLGDEDLEKIVSTMQVVKLAAKQLLFESGYTARYFYLVRNGQIKLFGLSTDGDEKVMDIVQPGQTFAEAITFMDRNTYPVNAEAIVDSSLYAFSIKTYRQLLENSTGACFHLMANMSRRLRERVSEINSLTLQNATYRLIVFLLDQVPGDVVQAPEIHLTTPKHIIASRLSIKPETFSRILSRLSHMGLISVHAHDVILNDVDGLRELLNE